MEVIYDQRGIPRKLSHLRAVEHLETLKKKSGSDPWPVIEQCFKIWESLGYKTWQSYLFRLEQVKQTRKRTRVGSKTWSGVSKDNEQDGYTVYTLDIPEKVMYMIRCLYTPEELPMNKPFFEEFGRRFPHLKVAERV